MRRYSIGRATTNDIVIDDMTVSRSHAELEETGRGRYMLRDHESTYGTKILRDGEWVEVIEVEVSSGTQVRFGEYEVNVGEIVATVDGDATFMPRRTAGDAPAAAGPANVAPAPAAPKPAKVKPPKPPKAPKAPRPAASGPGAPDKRMMTLILFAGGGAAALLVLVALVIVAFGGGTSTGTTADPGKIGGGILGGGKKPDDGGGGGGGGAKKPDDGGGFGGGGGNKKPDDGGGGGGGGNKKPDDGGGFGGGGGGGGGGGDGGNKAAFLATCKTLANRPATECECAWGVVVGRLDASERARFIAIIRNRTNAAKIQELLKDLTVEQRVAFGKKMAAVGTEIQQKCENK